MMAKVKAGGREQPRQLTVTHQPDVCVTQHITHKQGTFCPYDRPSWQTKHELSRYSDRDHDYQFKRVIPEKSCQIHLPIAVMNPMRSPEQRNGMQKTVGNVLSECTPGDRDQENYDTRQQRGGKDTPIAVQCSGDDHARRKGCCYSDIDSAEAEIGNQTPV